MQLSFGWPAARRRESLFFALSPDPDSARRIAETAESLRRALGLGGAPIAPERLHVSLLGIGRYETVTQPMIDGLGAVASAVKARPFALSFDRLACFGGNAIVLRASRPNEGLQALCHSLQCSLGYAMPRSLRRPRPFAPHMTLLYDPARFREIPIDPDGWTVENFALIQSHIGRRRHTCLGRWPLEAERPRRAKGARRQIAPA